MRNAIAAVCAVICVGCAGLEAPSRPAVGPQSSWDEIRGTPDLVVNAPMIPFGARAVSVTDVCRSGDRLRAEAADGAALETPAAGHRSSYTIEVGRIVGDGETSKFRALFVKAFEVPPCT
jgi:hypothetical protein